MLFSSKDERDISIILNVGSGSVAAAIVSLSKISGPKILFSLREPIPFQLHSNPARLPALMASALEKACKTILTDGIPRLQSAPNQHGKIREVLVTFCPPWYVSETRLLTIRNIKPFAFTEDLVSAALKKEAAEFEQKENMAKDQAACLDQDVMSVSLDGYRIEHPYGRRAVQADFSAYLSITSSPVLENSRSIIARHFSPPEIAFTSLPLLAFRVLRERVAKEKDFLLIDVSRELTEISLVKKDLIQETASFPLGKNHFIREIMKFSKSSPESAASELSLSLKNMATEEHDVKVRLLISKVAANWTQSLRETLENISEAHYIPSTIYILAQSDLEAFFADSAKQAIALSSTLSAENSSVEVINQEFLKGEYAESESAQADALMILSALYCNSRFANDRFGI